MKAYLEIPQLSERFDAACVDFRKWWDEVSPNPLRCPDCGRTSGSVHLTPCPNGRGPVPCRRYKAQPAPGCVCECGATWEEHERFDPASVAVP